MQWRDKLMKALQECYRWECVYCTKPSDALVMLWLLSYLPTCLFILRRSLCISRVRFGMSTGPVPTDHAACNVFTDALPRLGSTDIHIYNVCMHLYLHTQYAHTRTHFNAGHYCNTAKQTTSWFCRATMPVFAITISRWTALSPNGHSFT